jgi:hypothetical protein
LQRRFHRRAVQCCLRLRELGFLSLIRPLQVVQHLILLFRRQLNKVGVVRRTGPLVEVAYARDVTFTHDLDALSPSLRALA